MRRVQSKNPNIGISDTLVPASNGRYSAKGIDDAACLRPPRHQVVPGLGCPGTRRSPAIRSGLLLRRHPSPLHHARGAAARSAHPYPEGRAPPRAPCKTGRGPKPSGLGAYSTSLVSLIRDSFSKLFRCDPSMQLIEFSPQVRLRSAATAASQATSRTGGVLNPLERPRTSPPTTPVSLDAFLALHMPRGLIKISGLAIQEPCLFNKAQYKVVIQLASS